MKQIKTVAILSLLLLACNAFEMSGHEACVKVRETLGSKAQCAHVEEFLVFFQSSPIGNVVKFSKKSEKTLRVECLNFRVGIDLNKIPHLNFERVNKIELSECSVSTESLLSEIKARFKIKNVKFLSVVTTNEPNNVTLTENFFVNVSELEELEMKTNFRVKYSEETFKPLKNLKSLKLQVHDIIALPSNVFVPLENVRNLVISSSGMAKYETKKLNITLNKCINMESFIMVGIRWPVLIENGLVNFVGPLKVSLQNNRFELMSAKTFEKASHIEEMYLSNNSIKSLPKDIFASLTSLVIVDLSFNQIKEFPDETFSKSTSLEHINLSNNKIISVDR
jgi:Leucine rich repeat/BspA type Leucine rich repeat region (6 copies)